MDDRNTLFRKARSILTDRGMDSRNAGNLVSEQMKLESRRLSERQGGRRRGSAGGQAGKTPPVVLIDDLCEGLTKSLLLHFQFAQSHLIQVCCRIATEINNTGKSMVNATTWILGKNFWDP